MPAVDQLVRNVVDLFSPHAANQPGATPRVTPAPPMPAPGTNPDVAAVAQMHAGLWDGAPDETLQRLFPGGLSPEQQAFRDTYAAAQASDGMIDRNEGLALRAQANAVGTDQLSFLQSMYLRGHDPAQITALYEKLRGTDSANAGDATATHQDETGANLADPTRLTPEEMRLWRETQIARYEDLQAGTDMRKIVDPRQGLDFATGQRGNPGAVSASNTVGGFVSMASHTADQNAQQAMATTGLDSGYHSDVGMFRPDAANPQQQGTWSPQLQAQGATALNFELTAGQQADLNVPLGSFATDQMQLEAQRRMNKSGHAPRRNDRRGVRPRAPARADRRHRRRHDGDGRASDLAERARDESRGRAQPDEQSRQPLHRLGLLVAPSRA